LFPIGTITPIIGNPTPILWVKSRKNDTDREWNGVNKPFAPPGPGEMELFIPDREDQSD
jgi:hypothetical protein